MPYIAPPPKKKSSADSSLCNPSTLVSCNDGGSLVIGGGNVPLRQEQVSVRNGAPLGQTEEGQDLFWEYGYALSMTKSDPDTEFFGLGVSCFDCDQYDLEDPSDLPYSITSFNIGNSKGTSFTGFRNVNYLALPVKYTSRYVSSNRYGRVEIKSWLDTENLLSLDGGGFTVYSKTIQFQRPDNEDWSTTRPCAIYAVALFALPEGIGQNILALCSARMRPEIFDVDGGANFYTLFSFYTSTRFYYAEDFTPTHVECVVSRSKQQAGEKEPCIDHVEDFFYPQALLADLVIWNGTVINDCPVNPDTGFVCSGASQGVCNQAIGECVCAPNFAGSFCAECSQNHYSKACLACPSNLGQTCSGYGTCDDGLDGLGNCTCYEDVRDPGAGCADCKEGFFSTQCMPCKCQYGECEDGVGGDGTCLCADGWTGTLCDYDCSMVDNCSGHGTCLPLLPAGARLSNATTEPTLMPTQRPTLMPIRRPTLMPTRRPTGPLATPTHEPTEAPTQSSSTFCVCDDAWENYNCNVSQCLDDCNPPNGKCVLINGSASAQSNYGCWCDPSLPFDGASCANCIPGWFGATCSQQCECLNGGICSDGNSGDGSCDCREGYSGTICQDSPSMYLSTAEIVAVAVGSTIGLFVLLGLLGFSTRKFQEDSEPGTHYISMKSWKARKGSGSGRRSTESDDDYHGNMWTIDLTKLSMKDKIGAGSSAEVFSGLYCGTEVAVKRLYWCVSCFTCVCA